MKKRIIVLTSATIIMIIGGYFMLKLIFPKVTILDDSATLIYKYGNESISTSLSVEESMAIKSIFDGKRTYKDSPSCGFSEDVSLMFGNQVFCIACDNCPIIKLNNKYFRIAENDREMINTIFEKYGGLFPCN